MAAVALAAPPVGYYDSVVSFGNPTALRNEIHAVIDDHTRVAYDSGTNLNWDELNSIDENPGNSANIIDVYGNISYPKLNTGTGNPYNREHMWPNSYGLNDGLNNASGSGRFPFADLHHLHLSDSSYNSARGNRPFAHFYSPSGLTEYVTVTNNGVGGLGGTPFPGDSGWGTGTGNTGRQMVWSAKRGNAARALFYLDVRYDGTSHTIDTSGSNELEPDLILTNEASLIGTTDNVSDPKRAWMGELSTLIRWHYLDPVDAWEQRRTDYIYSNPGGAPLLSQGNRNPFIDNPSWVALVWDFDGAPAAPASLIASAGASQVDLDWDDNTDLDLDGYNIYRSTTSAVAGFTKINSSVVLISTYTDTGLVNATPYWYKVTAVDVQSPSNESGDSNVVTATPGDNTPPAAPTGLTANGGDGQVALDWNNNSEPDLAGYDVYRSSTSAIAGFAKINGSLVLVSNYTDSGVVNSTQYWYKVRAIDNAVPANASVDSSVATATPSASPTGLVIVGISTGSAASASHEWLALANPGSSSVDLSGWTVKSRTAASDTTITLIGIIPARGHYVIGSSAYAGTVEGVTADQSTVAGLFGGIGDATGRSVGLFNASSVLIDAISIGTGATTPYASEDGGANASGLTFTTTTRQTQSIYRKRPGGSTGPYTDTDVNLSDLEIRTSKVPPSDLAVPVEASAFSLY